MKKAGFTQVPNKITFDNRISDGAFRTFVAIRSYKYGERGKAFPSQETIGKRRGKTRETISKHVKEIKDARLWTVRKRGFSASNEYIFNGKEKLTNSKDRGESELTPIVEILPPLPCQKRHPNKTKENNTEIKKESLKKTRERGKERVRQKLIKLGLKEQDEVQG